MTIASRALIASPLWWLAGVLALAGCSATPPLATPASEPVAVRANPLPADRGSDNGTAVKAQDFAQWIANFRRSARAAGIDDSTLQNAFDGVHYLPRVIALDRAQPEFTRPVWSYLDSAVSAKRVARGQEKLGALRAQVDPIAARYGVPTEVLFAFWGVESNFGTDVGDYSVIDALATLGYEGRRGEWAQGELMAALKILQNHDIDRTRMLGSWAGAMGQTQFMPTIFLRYAVDADGDGRRDLWDSLADVMASTANFVAQSGWQTGQPWGVEVRLPAGFDYARADRNLRQSAAAWSGEGVQTMDGAPMPALANSYVLLPAGARGPAFLVGANFDTVLRYNNSISYALAVGLLAQQLAGGPVVQAPWPRDLKALSHSQLQALQSALNAHGFEVGTPDGLVGPNTQGGIRRYQRSQGLPADGYPSLELLQSLQASGAPAQ